jgi:hypothetical protein
MIGKSPLILYTLPKSRTTQAFFHGNEIEKIWESIAYFLKEGTTASIDKPSEISLTAYSAVKGDKSPELAEKILAETRSLFGKGKTSKMGEGFPTETSWEISNRDLPKAINYLINGQPWPKFTFGPVELIISYDFNLINPKTKTELPDQENSSDIMIWLSKRCSCDSNLWFPFIEADEAFFNYIKEVQRYLPFLLEHKYLKHGRPNKNGTSYIYRKVVS